MEMEEYYKNTKKLFHLAKNQCIMKTVLISFIKEFYPYYSSIIATIFIFIYIYEKNVEKYGSFGRIDMYIKSAGLHNEHYVCSYSYISQKIIKLINYQTIGFGGIVRKFFTKRGGFITWLTNQNLIASS